MTKLHIAQQEVARLEALRDARKKKVGDAVNKLANARKRVEALEKPDEG
jgi:hypothetical protein